MTGKMSDFGGWYEVSRPMDSTERARLEAKPERLFGMRAYLAAMRKELEAGRAELEAGVGGGKTPHLRLSRTS